MHRTWLVAFAPDDGPISYCRFDRETKKAELLFVSRPELESLKLARMQPIHFKAKDGLDLHGYLTLPVGVEPKQLPMVVLVHGGPGTRDEWGYDPTAQWQSDWMVEALRKHGKEVTYLLFQEGGRVEPPSEAEKWESLVQ